MQWAERIIKIRTKWAESDLHYSFDPELLPLLLTPNIFDKLTYSCNVSQYERNDDWVMSNDQREKIEKDAVDWDV